MRASEESARVGYEVPRDTLAVPECYHLRLYVAGATHRSVRAIQNIKAICEAYLAGRYKLEIFDVCRHPALAREEQIVAAPTLVKAAPAPVRRLIGDMSDRSRVLAGLGLDRVFQVQGHDAGD
ncbi:MAG: hypothetical protein H0T90_02380 [Gemmatimonadales bacterium]|nr:hypothetical protein [Gemmatimonadales bacterium]MDQ3221961.1 circadian clock KaiB family protein [Gemmatimonadota bacterium]